jgi:hypothetical protein
MSEQDVESTAVEPAQSAPEPLPASPKPGRKQWIMFAAGFLGWYLINGPFWLLFPVGKGENIILGILTLPANVIVLTILSSVKGTRWIGFGILAAIAFNLVISLIMGLVVQGLCLIPFFTK